MSAAFAAALLLALASLGQTVREHGKLPIDNSLEIWFLEDDPALVQYRAFLEQWGNDPEVCRGGLFHSIYGTQSYKMQSASLDDRQRIRDVIDERSERLAFLFCVTRRGQFFEELGKPDAKLHDRIHKTDEPVTQDELRDLIEMEMANYIEFMARTAFTNEELDDFSGRVDSARSLITDGAYQDIREAIADKREAIRKEFLGDSTSTSK